MRIVLLRINVAHSSFVICLFFSCGSVCVICLLAFSFLSLFLQQQRERQRQRERDRERGRQQTSLQTDCKCNQTTWNEQFPVPDLSYGNYPFWLQSCKDHPFVRQHHASCSRRHMASWARRVQKCSLCCNQTVTCPWQRLSLTSRVMARLGVTVQQAVGCLSLTSRVMARLGVTVHQVVGCLSFRRFVPGALGDSSAFTGVTDKKKPPGKKVSSVHVWMCVCTCVCVCVYIYVHACMCARVYVCVYVCLCSLFSIVMFVCRQVVKRQSTVLRSWLTFKSTFSTLSEINKQRE